MANELLEHFLDVQFAGFAIDKRQEDDREGLLEGGELVELVQDDIRIGVLFDLDNQADWFF